MKICFLSSMHPPRDKRVFDKEAISLAQAGFEVIHLAPDDGPSAVERGVKIITYPRPRGIRARLLQIPRLYGMARQINADCYHCNEVDSWLVGVLLKLTMRRKVVFDVHEHYPSTFAESRFPPVLHPLIAAVIRLIFRVLTLFTDRLVFAKRSVAFDFRGSEAKQVLVQNFTSLAFRDEAPVQRTDVVAEKADCLTAIHLGLISRVRGWPQLLDALAQLKLQQLYLTVIGTFNDGSKEAFDAKVSASGLSSSVTTIDWLPFEEAYQQIICADIGLILFQPGIQNHVFALPHKMFDYMLAGLPVIAPRFAEEVSHIIRESDCGVLVDSADPSDIAQALGHLVANPQERKRLGENGRRAVLERYNWEAEAARLVAMYQELADADHAKLNPTAYKI